MRKTLGPNPRPQTPGERGEAETNKERTNPVISLDPSAPLGTGPLIADILRTGDCVPGSVFLVESVERRVRVPSPGGSADLQSGGHGGRAGDSRRRRQHGRRRPRRAVRLLLGDGELCIQAFVRAEIHCLVDAGSVYEGCYVRLDTFGLEIQEVVEGGVAERVVYLVVRDMVTVGWNEEYMGILRRAVAEGVARVGGDDDEEVSEAGGGGGFAGADGLDEQEEEELIRMLDEGLGRPTAAAAELPPSGAPPREEPDEPDDADSSSDSGSAFETLTVSVERANQRRITVTAPEPDSDQDSDTNPDPDPRQQLQAAIIKQNQQSHQQQQQQQQQQQHQQNQHVPNIQNQPPPQPQPLLKPRPWLPTDASQPLKLTPLSQIPHLPYRQNWMVNVLAVLTDLSPTQPSHIGPSFRQRTARLADLSTRKRVHLTVYLDPDAFAPREGSVVLLLGVKNHFFDGGSLRKYVSDRLGGGASWWVERPEERIGWCRAGAARLRAWWAEKSRRGAEGEGEGG